MAAMHAMTPIRHAERASLLGAPEEHVKLPLPMLASSIVEDIRKAEQLGTLCSANVIRWFNLGALASYQSGQIEWARRLCVAAVELCLSNLGRQNQPEWVTALLQPFVNLGRLDAICGNLSSALERFRSVFLFAQQVTDLKVFDRTVPVGTLDEVHGVQEPVRIVTNSYVGDSIRACLAAQDHLSLAEFLQSCDTPYLKGTFAWRFVLEGHIRLCLSNGDVAQALLIARELLDICKKDRPLDPAILRILCDVYLTIGDLSSTRQVLQRMMSYCDQLESAPKYQRMLKRSLYQAALCAFACSSRECGINASLRCLQLAVGMADESTRIRVTCMLSSMEQHVEPRSTPCYHVLLSNLANTSYYRTDQMVAYMYLYDTYLNPYAHGIARELCVHRLRSLEACLMPADVAYVASMCSSSFEEVPAAHTQLAPCAVLQLAYEHLMEYACSCTV